MNLKGYIFSREFFGERVPQHIQNIILKDYCRNKNINFLLSATEYNSKDSTFILYELVKDINKYDGYLFYSLFQLPKNKKKRHNFFKKIRDNGKELHFAVENLIVKNQFDYDKVEKIFLLKGSLYPEQKINRGKLRNFVTKNHEKTKRDYLERMMNQKIECMKVSKKYGYLVHKFCFNRRISGCPYTICFHNRTNPNGKYLAAFVINYFAPVCF